MAKNKHGSGDAFFRFLDYKIVALVPGANPPLTRPAPEGWTSETDRIIAEVFAKQRAAKARRTAGEPPPGPAGSSPGAEPQAGGSGGLPATIK